MTKTVKTEVYIVLPIVACIILFMLEQVFLVDYLTKTIAKLILFTGIPLLVRVAYKQNKSYTTNVPGLFKRILPGMLIGAGVMAVIFTAYMLFKRNIDAAAIMAELNQKSKITKETYLYTGIYISLANSFLEELFFRKHIFLGLYRTGWVKLAYAVSALLFSVYHIAIFNTWFSLPIQLLALLGLFAAGLVFDYIAARTGSLLSSWMIHICANVAIVAIGWSWL